MNEDNQVYDKLIVVYQRSGAATAVVAALNVATKLAQQNGKVLLIDWGAGGEVATALGIQATRGLHDWLHNEDRGGSRLGYERFVQATPVHQLWAFSGHLPVDDVKQETVDGHLNELMWASSFDYVVCDVPAVSAALVETLLKFRPGVVLIPVVLDSTAHLEVEQLHQAYCLVQRLSPHSQLILLPTFEQVHGPLTLANLALLQSLYPGAVTAVYDEVVRWIQKGAPEILFGADG